MTWIIVTLAVMLAGGWALRLAARLAGRLRWYPRCSRQHFALLEAAWAVRRGRPGPRELEFITAHGIDPGVLARAAPCLAAVSGAQLAYACRMLRFGPALAWSVAVAAHPGGCEAVQVVHAVAVSGRRARRLCRATSALICVPVPRRRIGRSAAVTWLRGVVAQAGGGHAAVMSRRGSGCR
jgi:hypothetical protein